MVRQYDRPAIITAVVNALVALLLPPAVVIILSTVANGVTNGSTTAYGVDPDRAAVLTRKVRSLVTYGLFMAPFAMVAAWRTFVHAKRWLTGTGTGAQGILEAAACGFLGVVVLLLSGILTSPLRAAPYVIVYGGLSAMIGLVFGLVLWASATVVLRAISRQA